MSGAALVVIPIVLSRCCGRLDRIRLAAKRHQLLRRIDGNHGGGGGTVGRCYQLRFGNRIDLRPVEEVTEFVRCLIHTELVRTKQRLVAEAWATSMAGSSVHTVVRHIVLEDTESLCRIGGLA